MKLRLASPALLVDVGRLRDLSYVRDGGDHVAVGALTRQAYTSEGRHPLASSFHMSTSMDAYQAEVRKASAFAFLVRDDRSLPQAAYRFLLQHPCVTTVISVASYLSQLEEFASWSETPALSSDDIRKIEEVWNANFRVRA